MPSTPVEPLADAAWAFLERALDEIVPERDVPASQELCRRVVDAWPVDDEGWDAARKELALALAKHLQTQPRSWARVLDLVGLYLDRATLDEPHPRQEDAVAKRRGQRVYPVAFGLGRALIDVLLEGSEPAQRMNLYDTLDEWQPWMTVAAALEARPLPLSAEEISTLLARAVHFTRGDGGAGLVLGPLMDGLRASTENVDALLDGWFERRDLDPSVIGLLALWRLPRRENSATLRQRLVGQLLRLPPKQGARVAVHVAFRSWSKDAEIMTRRDALLECLEYLGAEGVAHALAALAYDPSITPQHALSILDMIVKHLDDAGQRDAVVAAERVNVLHWIAKSSLASDVQVIVDRLPTPTAFPAEEHRLHQLDWLLSTLAAHDATPVRAYVLDWIETHAASLAGEGLDLLLSETRAHLPGARWLVEAAVSRRPALRHGALRCLLRSTTRPSPQDFAGLDERQVLALAHMILSEAALGAGLVDLLFELARSRTDCLERLGPLLGEETQRTYPDQYRQCVETWAAVLEDRPEDDAERATVASLQTLLGERQRAALAKRALSTMIFDRTSPTRRPLTEVLARAFHEGLSQSNSLFRMVATRIPIACGAASTFEFGDADARHPQPFKKVSEEAEFPALDAYDPIAAHYFRFLHEHRAAELLSPNEGAP
jgi:hypothetical protein